MIFNSIRKKHIIWIIYGSTICICFVYNMSCFLAFFPQRIRGLSTQFHCHGWWVVDFWPFGLKEDVENLMDPWDWYMGVNPKIVGKPPKWMVKIRENPMNELMIWGGTVPLFLGQHPYLPTFIYAITGWPYPQGMRESTFTGWGTLIPY